MMRPNIIVPAWGRFADLQTGGRRNGADVRSLQNGAMWNFEKRDSKKVENQESQKNQRKRLWMAAGILCLAVFGGILGGKAKRFFKEEPGKDIVISVEESQGEQEETLSGQEDKESSNGGQKDNSQNDRILSRGLKGILKGGIEMARRTLEREEKDGLQRGPDKSRGSGEDLDMPWQEDQEAGPPVIYLVSDLHYMSSMTTDYGKAFQQFEAKSDGKVIRYLPQVLDALLEETVREKPDAIVFTGDITMNGEEINHLELARKLARIQESGIQVLVIPGNHDINNPDAGVYFGEKAETAQAVDPQGFWEIYHGFGPDQAVSRDEGSFSYVYPLRDDIWLMLLDTAQYEPRNLVEGMVRPGTLQWMDENLKEAEARNIQVIVLGHHNLLSESRMFTTMCTLENGEEVRRLLESYHVLLYISGHLHLQRINQHKKGPGDTGYGIYEIVSNAVSIPPCQYGILTWQDNGDMDYGTRKTDVEAWAAKCGEEDENLLAFSAYGETYIRQLVEAQIKGEAKQVREKTAGEMARIYADVYADYCAGVAIDERERMRSWEYRQWENCWPQSDEAKALRAMIGDCFRDYNTLHVPGVQQP